MKFRVLANAQLYFVLLVSLITFSSCDEMRNLNYELDFNKTAFMTLNFDSSFFKALFIEKHPNSQLLKILNLDDLTTKNYFIHMASPLVFSGLMNTGNIVLICQTNGYIASKFDGYSLFEMTQISDFLQKNTITSNASFNDFNQTILAVYNNNKIAELDVRLPQQARVNQFSFKIPEGDQKISVLNSVYINGGDRFAVQLENTTNQVELVQVYDQKNKNFLQQLSDNVDDTRRMAYNVEMNLLLLVKYSSKTIILVDCKTYKEVGVINFSLTGLDATKISNLYSPLGTKVLLIISGHRVYTFDLGSKAFIKEYVLPDNPLEVYWAESTQYFISKHEKGTDKVTFRVFKLESADARYCHKSCGSDCELVFKPCYNTWGIIFSMFIASLVLIVLSVSTYYCLIWIVKREKASDIFDENGTLYELSDEGVRPKRNTISLEPDQLTI